MSVREMRFNSLDPDVEKKGMPMVAWIIVGLILAMVVISILNAGFVIISALVKFAINHWKWVCAGVLLFMIIYFKFIRSKKRQKKD